MSQINILDSQIFNRISAGEVIVKPMSVVKECVENSIDSGATKISIFISNGTRNIKIIDNGCGMSREDAEICFLPHTTSKIQCVEDLDNIATLGFRGEALASIASIAQISLDTCDCVSGECTRVEIDNAKVTKTQTSKILQGTEIYVQNLFYNTPVRAKFLKSDRSEQGDITNLVSKLILSNPNIAIEYYVDNVEKLKFDGGGVEKAIYLIYGKSALTSCIELKSLRNGITVNGFIGKADFTKSNRTYQTCVLNGRYITNETISTAIFKAYQPFLMKRAYPFYVLYIDVPTEIVDVNAHPTKNDVRFSDNNLIFSTLHGIARDVLTSEARGFSAVETTYIDTSNINREKSNYEVECEKQIYENGVPPKIEEIQKSKFDFTDLTIEEANENFRQDSIIKKKIAPEWLKCRIEDITPRNIVLDKKNYTSKQIVEPEIPLEVYDNDFGENRAKATEYHLIGVFLNSYILAECRNELVLIDQHAAHERFLYDNYSASYYRKSVDVQELLVPYMFNLNFEEELFLKRHISNLYVLGFQIEHFGDRTFQLRTIPNDLSGINLPEFISELFSDPERLLKFESVELVSNTIIQRACKHAVKAGDSLEKCEIDYVFKMLEVSDSLFCPHGRPIVVKFDLKDIEKMFKRIVWRIK